MPQPYCPSTEQLKHYLLGIIAEEAAQDLATHLEECPACLKTLDTIRSEDTFTDALRGDRPSSEEVDLELEEKIRQRLRLMQLHPSAFMPSTVKSPSAGVPSEGTISMNWSLLLRPAESPDELGRLGDYRVMKVLGSGGMGIVFLAEDMKLKREVALKILSPALAASKTASQRFLREAQAAAALRHKNIVTIYQVGQDANSPFFAMELLEGESLEDRLKREKKRFFR